jgi:hypothetical protein
MRLRLSGSVMNGSIERVEARLVTNIDRGIFVVNHAIHQVLLRRNFSRWRPISTAPYNRDLELRLDEGSGKTAPFPCRHLNGGEWINVDLGTRMRIRPISWRVWRQSDSPKPHHSVQRR